MAFKKNTTHLNVGEKAPDFSGLDEQGSVLKLSDFSGKKLILFFYPKDNTPGCTAEACSLSENYNVLTKRGFEVLGVSADTQRKHQNFIKKFGFQYHLLADVDKEVIRAYGVWGEKQFMGRIFDGILRTTFVIDEQGTIEKIFATVNTRNHTEQILEAMEIKD